MDSSSRQSGVSRSILGRISSGLKRSKERRRSVDLSPVSLYRTNSLDSMESCSNRFDAKKHASNSTLATFELQKEEFTFRNDATNTFANSVSNLVPVTDLTENQGSKIRRRLTKAKNMSINFAKFIGPGMMISIAYMDPGNYSTDVSAGAQKKFSLLFVVLLSNILAIFLQSLGIKLGSVTGEDLAVNCRRHFPRWLSLTIYGFAEIAIIATDIAEVIGTAVALNILIHLPLIAGVILTIVDVMLVLLAYRPGKGMYIVRLFEYGVTTLLFGVVICFAIELSRIPKSPVGEVFRGYLPSRDIIDDKGLYLSCGILGATVMPHSLYLGSSLVKPRIRDYDIRHGNCKQEQTDEGLLHDSYQPSLAAINHCLKYSIIELVVALCTVAMFVNSAILIVAGSTMYNNPKSVDSDLYSIYDLLVELLSKTAGILFMVALLLSGQSAGIICTIAGQIVSEGHINWKIRPWIRRIVTRVIAILPCLIVVAVVGKSGLNSTLNASQVALSVLLPFLTAPLIYLTSMKKVMTVYIQVDGESFDNYKDDKSVIEVDKANSWPICILGFAVWLFVTILNVYLIVQLGIEK
jgi:metal iron transporter